MAEPRSKFLEGTNLQFAFDSQDLGAAKDCPRKYFYQAVRGLRRKRLNTNQTFGAAFHKGLETFELKKAAGATLSDSLDAALQAAREDSVTMEDHRAKTKESLLTSLSAYIAHHENEPLETVKTREGSAAVELRLEASLSVKTQLEPELLYCGYIDRIANFNGDALVVDHKTTSSAISTEKGSKSYFAQWAPDNQFTGYLYLCLRNGINAKGVLIDAMQIAKTKVEFARAITHRTSAQIEEWRLGAVSYARQMLRFGEQAIAHDALTAVEQERFYPMNERACHSKYGPCVFASICSKDPSVREAFLSTDFEVKHWNPFETRTEGTIEPETSDE